jgi:hypothetical protein
LGRGGAAVAAAVATAAAAARRATVAAAADGAAVAGRGVGVGRVAWTAGPVATVGWKAAVGQCAEDLGLRPKSRRLSAPT